MPGSVSDEEMRRRGRRMGDLLRHRGPDEGDVWVDAAAGAALVHRRLSIIDLSSEGHQPMVSAAGRFVICYNGELYNTGELRRTLEETGHRFRGHSDTEVVLEGFAAWGVEQTVPRLRGMFAIALWDRHDRVLYLIRDRLGIKPLYWGRFGSLVVFGSELKALVAHGGWTPEIDRNALASYMRFGYVPAPASIWSGVFKLRPGRILAFHSNGKMNETEYWSAAAVARKGIAHRRGWAMDDESAVDALDALLRNVVREHMVSDVPLGAFLSGGYDSSVVVAMMQLQSTRPVETFSIGFREHAYDEAQHARAVAGHLGTKHTELYLEPDRALEIIPRLPAMHDEPFADPSQIPTFLLCEMTRAQVTVALSGDGGDELFAGYDRYALTRKLWRWLGPLPGSLRRAAGSAAQAIPMSWWDRLAGGMPGLFSGKLNGARLHRIAELVGMDAESLYRCLIGQWHEPSAVVVGGRASPWADCRWQVAPDLLDWMQLTDLVTYMPDDILTKVDRASMAVALEARVPLLDHRLVEFAWSLPQNMKVRGGRSKWILREVLYRYVPRELMDRPKMGFGVPIESWLRGPLRDWAETLLSEARLASEGYLNPGPIRRSWQEHLSGGSDRQYPLWTVLMFQAWLEHQKNA